MQTSSTAAQVSVPGFVDHHAHLLRDAAGVEFPQTRQAVRDFHLSVAEQGRSPMDVLDPPGELAGPDLGDRLVAGLRRAATAGLVEVTESADGVAPGRRPAVGPHETARPLAQRPRASVASRTQIGLSHVTVPSEPEPFWAGGSSPSAAQRGAAG